MNENLTIIIAAFAGALGAGMTGWMKSGSPFAWREFAGTVWAAILSSAVFALGFEGEASFQNIIFAFLSGAGVDVLNRRVAEIRTNGRLAEIEKQIIEKTNRISGSA
ncbi:MAG: hypothetical protein PHU23_00185 [Dehalococcoidales bacterium]|nr:hypothetical protein [Dehalococcoidales bacterium]